MDDENDIFAGYVAYVMQVYDCCYPLIHTKNQMVQVSDELAAASTNSYISRWIFMGLGNDDVD